MLSCPPSPRRAGLSGATRQGGRVEVGLELTVPRFAPRPGWVVRNCLWELDSVGGWTLKTLIGMDLMEGFGFLFLRQAGFNFTM